MDESTNQMIDDVLADLLKDEQEFTDKSEENILNGLKNQRKVKKYKKKDKTLIRINEFY